MNSLHCQYSNAEVAKEKSINENLKNRLSDFSFKLLPSFLVVWGFELDRLNIVNISRWEIVGLIIAAISFASGVVGISASMSETSDCMKKIKTERKIINWAPRVLLYGGFGSILAFGIYIFIK